MNKTFLDIDEIQCLENSADNLRDRLLIRLHYFVACRVSEVLGLTVSDINFNQGSITIEHLKTRITLFCPECNVRLSKSHRFCPGCGVSVERAVAREKQHRRMRTLPCDPDTLELLKEYIDRGGPVSQNGKRVLFGITRFRVREIVKECARKAGLPMLINSETGKLHHVSPHRLRDAFAVHAVQTDDSGDGLRLLQEHLGHKSIVTTMRYRKVAGEEQREWFDKLWQRD
ncbi:MAG: Tyrosine recombinase XerD [Dehalococcoidia bacterium]|nr:Tyrosine recombinase XerD [Chloroflexota bacterium]